MVCFIGISSLFSSASPVGAQHVLPVGFSYAYSPASLSGAQLVLPIRGGGVFGSPTSTTGWAFQVGGVFGSPMRVRLVFILIGRRRWAKDDSGGFAQWVSVYKKGRLFASRPFYSTNSSCFCSNNKYTNSDIYISRSWRAPNHDTIFATITILSST